MPCAGASGEAHCWCENLPALDPVPGRGCLCRNCLLEELKLRARSERDPRP